MHVGFFGKSNSYGADHQRQQYIVQAGQSCSLAVQKGVAGQCVDGRMQGTIQGVSGLACSRLQKASRQANQSGELNQHTIRLVMSTPSLRAL